MEDCKITLQARCKCGKRFKATEVFRGYRRFDILKAGTIKAKCPKCDKTISLNTSNAKIQKEEWQPSEAQVF